MPNERPVVHGLTRETLLERVEQVAPYYTDEWHPDSGDAGRAVFELFSEMVADVTDRLNRVPEKHRIAFYDELGFARRPPQPARLPLQVTLVDDAEANVPIRAGTRATAPAEGDGPEQTFEIPSGGGFEATPAALSRIYSVDPETDRIVEHQSALQSGGESRLFGGRNLQEHALHVGHGDLFDLSAGVEIWVVWTPSEPVGGLTWEYYEERDGDADGDHWHPLEKQFDRSVTGGTVTSLRLPDAAATVTETTVGGVESRWIRALPDANAPAGLLELEVTEMCLLVAPRSVSEAAGSVTRASATGTAGSPTAVRPDRLLSNAVQLAAPPLPGASPEESIHPFGGVVQPGDAFYIASDAAFSKRGTKVALELAVESPSGGNAGAEPPDVSWQYWNGTAWALLDDWEYRTSSGWRPVEELESSDWQEVLQFVASGSVRFTVPDDIEPTQVAGHDGRWIRALSMEGQHGRVKYKQRWVSDDPATPEDESGWEWTLLTENLVVPVVTNLGIYYGDVLTPSEIGPSLTAVLDAAENDDRPEHLIGYNNLAYETHPAGDGLQRFRPFDRLPETDQTIYFGFDAPLRGGPIPLFVSQTDREYPESFHSRLRWEYAETAAGDAWRRPGVRDGTRGLTERGVVRFTFPESTAARPRFGERLHWVRATVTGESFDVPPQFELARLFLSSAVLPVSWASYEWVTRWLGLEETTRGTDRREETPSACLDSCEGAARLATEPPAGTPTRESPTLRGVYPNTTWAIGVRTVADERLGSSDGRPEQSFVVSTPPVSEASVWVDERQVRSDAEMRELVATRPDDVEEVTDANGRPLAFWVRWQEVPDLFASGADDRHYTLDRFEGRLSFGDGVRGAIPPRGRDNVRATYETGGGAASNVAAGSVAELTAALDLVDVVTNPEAADGGADAESVDAVLSRAPKELRDRDRAVTKADFERVTMAASRKLARARCIPRMDEAGTRRLGWVTVLVVPTSTDRRPMPSAELRERVVTALEARAPATLVAPTRRLVVRGPSYVDVSVAARLVARDAESVSGLERAADEAIAAFLHPLTGGHQGDGWEFGRLPCASDFYVLLEDVEGVDYVDDLSVTFEGVGTGDRITVGEGDPEPTVAPDALVSSGSHAVRVRLAPERVTTGRA